VEALPLTPGTSAGDSAVELLKAPLPFAAICDTPTSNSSNSKESAWTDVEEEEQTTQNKMKNFDEGGKFENNDDDAEGLYFGEFDLFDEFVHVEGEPEGDKAFDGDFTLV